MASSDGQRVADGASGVTETLPSSPGGRRRWTVAVEVVSPGEGGRLERRRLPDEGLVVGSGRGASLVLRDRAVSARHARLEGGPRYVHVHDLGSRNGTWVDGARVSTGAVAPGATLRLGRTVLRVFDEGGEGAEPFVAASPQMQAVLAEARRLAPLPWPVLVVGETGVGKEEVARMLHRASLRAAGPFVAVNAGGLPRELVESELFGHERGAFTGALATHRGLFERAEGGTLFLDEIGELELALQSRLLRVLESGELRRVGADRVRRVDVRLVCATHRDLPAAVRTGTFRQDLYFRIARTVLPVPPLRARPADVLALAAHFLAHIEREVGRRELTPGARRALLSHRWPGNARELRNVLCAAAAAAPDLRIDAPDVERALARLGGVLDATASPETLLALHGGNVAAAARALGVARSTFRDRLRRG